jgi:hypothetical protein
MYSWKIYWWPFADHIWKGARNNVLEEEIARQIAQKCDETLKGSTSRSYIVRRYADWYEHPFRTIFCPEWVHELLSMPQKSIQITC